MNRLNRSFIQCCLLLSGVLLAACGGSGSSGGGNGQPPTGNPEPQNPPGNGTAQLTWNSPTQTEGGTALAGLSGYRIYYGSEQGVYDRMVELTDPTATGHSFDNLTAGTWHFMVTAYDAEGNESRPVGPVSKSVQ